MLDIRLIRESPNAVRANLARRRATEKVALLEDAIAFDRDWRRHLQELQALRHRRNAVSQEIGNLVKAGKDTTAHRAEAAALPERIEGLEILVDDLRAKLVEALALGDFERAAKVAGAGFVYLRGDLVLLDQALLWFTLKLLVSRGFTPVFPPFILRRSAYQGVVDLKDFEDVMYKIEGEDAFLIATSEHPLVSMFQDEILEEATLPLRFAGIATQFRKEIGAHGVDTKGLFRMHQFNKVEQVIFSRPEDSWRFHEELLGNAEAVFRALEIPHRTVVLCSADTGSVMAKTYDLEAWFPRQNAYREVASCSNAVDYQARRLGIRVGKAGGEKRLAHTLNSTAVATSRALVAILENGQNADGTVTVPKVLREFVGKDVIGRAG